MTIERIGEACRTARKARGMPQWEAAELAGYVQAAISLLERGKKQITLDTLFRIMDIVGLKLSVGGRTVGSPEEVYGMIRHAQVRKKWNDRKVSEASGVSMATIRNWNDRKIGNAYAECVLTVAEGLKLKVDFIQEEL